MDQKLIDFRSRFYNHPVVGSTLNRSIVDRISSEDLLYNGGHRGFQQFHQEEHVTVVPVRPLRIAGECPLADSPIPLEDNGRIAHVFRNEPEERGVLAIPSIGKVKAWFVWKASEGLQKRLRQVLISTVFSTRAPARFPSADPCRSISLTLIDQRRPSVSRTSFLGPAPGCR